MRIIPWNSTHTNLELKHHARRRSWNGLGQKTTHNTVIYPPKLYRLFFLFKQQHASIYLLPHRAMMGHASIFAGFWPGQRTKICLNGKQKMDAYAFWLRTFVGSSFLNFCWLILEMFCSSSYVIFTLSHVLVISWKWCTGSRCSIMKMECSRLTPNQENPGYRESWYPTTMGKKSTWGLYVITDSRVSEAHAASKNPTVVIEASMSSLFCITRQVSASGTCTRHARSQVI